MEDVSTPLVVTRHASPEPGPHPSSSARLTLSMEPAKIEGTAEGIVPAGEAHALITTFGMVAMGVVGITGATITLHMAQPHALGWFFGLAVAELALAATVIGLIARREPFPVRARRSRNRANPGRL